MGLCTTCKGRADHLRETLAHNFSIAESLGVELYVLDYDSPDDVADVVSSVPGVKLIRSQPHQYYNSSHAKNVAAVEAAKLCDILVNVDADVFVTHEILHIVYKNVIPGNRFVSCWGGDGGVCGFIAMHAQDFVLLRGYDEAMPVSWGYDDTDLKVRALNSGMDMVAPRLRSISVIKHSDHDRMKHMQIKDKADGHKAKTSYVSSRTGIINPNGFGSI